MGRPPGEKMKSYWLIAAAVVFALIIGALTPLPRDHLAQTAKTGGKFPRRARRSGRRL